MTILYYFWGENSEHDIEQVLLQLGHRVLKITYPFKDYNQDELFFEQLHNVFITHKPDLVFSFNFFPVLSDICQKDQILYFSWIYDCPHFSLFSKSVYNDCNRIFLFDKVQYHDLEERHVNHIYHLLLAANTTRLKEYIPVSFPVESFMHNISFVGSFYENNMFSNISYLPDYLQGYIQGILSAQGKIWGMDLLSTLLTTDFLSALKPYIDYAQMDGYQISFHDFCLFLFQQQLTCQERNKYLNLISEHFPLDIYSGSNTNVLCPKAAAHGFISYYETMPQIFNHSKINLNISLRSITSGIPLRCMDILGAGGFLLSNFQSELVDAFVPEQDFVYFEDEKDLLDKIQFYLTHEQERMKIAAHGFQTIRENYSYEIQIQKMLSYI